MDGESREALAERARKVEADIVKGCRAVRTFGGVYLAGKFHEFLEGRMWEPLGYESQGEFLASPDIELGTSTVKNMVTVYRSLVVDRGVDPKALEGVDLRKVQYALPAVSSGDVLWQDAIAAARTLTRDDMKRRFSGDPNARLDAEAEPERVTCPRCGSFVEAGRIENLEDAA